MKIFESEVTFEPFPPAVDDGSAALRRHFLGEWNAYYAPTTPAGRGWIDQAVRCRIEQQRCLHLIDTLRAERGRLADIEWQQNQENQIVNLDRLFATDSVMARIGLMRFSTGCRYMISRWEQFQAHLTADGTLYGAERIEAIQLLGYSGGVEDLYFDEEPYWFWVYCLAAQPNPKQRDIDLCQRTTVIPKAIQDKNLVTWRPDPEFSRRTLHETIDRELATLRALSERLYREQEIPERAAARSRAAARVCPEETALLRQVQIHERSFLQAARALEELRPKRERDAHIWTPVKVNAATEPKSLTPETQERPADAGRDDGLAGPGKDPERTVTTIDKTFKNAQTNNTNKCSARKILANQMNSQKSTGPRSESGKSVSRLNGVSHAMTALLPVYLEGENREAIEQKINIWCTELGVGTEAERTQIANAVHAQLRVERCRKAEEEARQEKIHEIVENDERQEAEVDDLCRRLPLEPKRAFLELQNSSQGVAALIQRLEAIDRFLEEWTSTERFQRYELLNLLGRRPEDLFTDRRVMEINLAYLGGLHGDGGTIDPLLAAQVLEQDRHLDMDPGEFARRLSLELHKVPGSRKESQAALRALIAEEIAKLLDRHELILGREQRKLESELKQAQVDVSNEGERRSRYHARNQRQHESALNGLHKLQRSRLENGETLGVEVTNDGQGTAQERAKSPEQSKANAEPATPAEALARQSADPAQIVFSEPAREVAGAARVRDDDEPGESAPG